MYHKKSSKHFSTLSVRPEEIRPVAAWVLPGCTVPGLNAEISAIEEERKMHDWQTSKEITQINFQKEIQQRLLLAAKSKRENQVEQFLRNAKLKHRIFAESHCRPSTTDDIDRPEDIYSDDLRHEVTRGPVSTSEFMELSRRAFMDAERERVVENKRRQTLRRKLKMEKQIKEAKEIFKVNNLRVVKGEPEMSMEASHDDDDYDSVDEESIINSIQADDIYDEEQRRLISRLKEDLAEKLLGSKRPLPQLCLCSPNVFGTSPSTCAYNCIFYKNPTALIRALKSFFSS